jgi:hypothetical protein
MPDQPSSPQATPVCKRCRSELQYVAAIPKRIDSPPLEIFRCAKCDEMEWVERK